jgi:Rrf2 family protein
MIRFSKKLDYTLVLLTDLVKHPDRVASSSALARQYGISQDLVANLLKVLCRAGIVTSIRGKQGGYKIAKEPSCISLKEIITMIDGKFSLTECGSRPGNQCERSGICGSRAALLNLTGTINEMFEKLTLEDFLKETERQGKKNGTKTNLS